MQVLEIVVFGVRVAARIRQRRVEEALEQVVAEVVVAVDAVLLAAHDCHRPLQQYPQQHARVRPDALVEPVAQEDGDKVLQGPDLDVEVAVHVRLAEAEISRGRDAPEHALAMHPDGDVPLARAASPEHHRFVPDDEPDAPLAHVIGEQAEQRVAPDQPVMPAARRELADLFAGVGVGRDGHDGVPFRSRSHLACGVRSAWC